MDYTVDKLTTDGVAVCGYECTVQGSCGKAVTSDKRVCVRELDNQLQNNVSKSSSVYFTQNDCDKIIRHDCGALGIQKGFETKSRGMELPVSYPQEEQHADGINCYRSDGISFSFGGKTPETAYDIPKKICETSVSSDNDFKPVFLLDATRNDIQMNPVYFNKQTVPDSLSVKKRFSGKNENADFVLQEDNVATNDANTKRLKHGKQTTTELSDTQDRVYSESEKLCVASMFKKRDCEIMEKMPVSVCDNNFKPEIVVTDAEKGVYVETESNSRDEDIAEEIGGVTDENDTLQHSCAPETSRGENVLTEEDAAAVESISQSLPVETSPRFQCKLCKKFWNCKKDLTKHTKTHTKKFICSVCDVSFENMLLLKKHLPSHSDHTSSVTNSGETIVRAHSCPHCSYKAKQKTDLKKHMVVHSTTNLHKCQLCKFSCKRKFSLHRHIKRVHSTARIYDCVLCNFKSSVFDSFKAHMKVHMLSCKMSCVICGIVIKEQSNMIEHLLSHCMGLKNSCKKCDKIYFTSLQHMEHLSSHRKASSTTVGVTYPDLNLGSSLLLKDSTGHSSTVSSGFLDIATVDAKLSQMSSAVSRLTDMTKAATLLRDDNSSVSVQLVNISSLATELAMISNNLLQSYKNSCVVGDSSSSRTYVGPVSSDVVGYSYPFIDNDYELHSDPDIAMANVKEEWMDMIYPSIDTDMQIQVDLNVGTIMCIQKSSLFQQSLGTSKPKKVRHKKCVLCNLVFTDTSTLRRHLLAHIDARPHSCEQCGQSFRRKEHLNRHMVTHSSERPFVCKECHYRAKTEVRLKMHMSSHSESKEFACQFCSYSGKTGFELNRHMKRHKPETCSQCSWVCCSRAELKKHMSTHTSFECAECHFITHNRIQFTRHVKKHTLIQHLCCELCGYSCDTMRKFQYHKLRHENRTPYECSECDYKCSSRASFDGHRLKHAGLRPYLCSFCGSSFRNSSHLNLHMRIHKDEKAFKCSICGYSCRTKYNLKEHQMTHSGEKPHICKQCGFSSRRKKALLLHMLKH